MQGCKCTGSTCTCTLVKMAELENRFLGGEEGVEEFSTFDNFNRVGFIWDRYTLIISQEFCIISLGYCMM